MTILSIVNSRKCFYGLLIVCFMHSGVFGQELPLVEPMSTLDSILNVPINSASRYWQTANDAPASVSIITAEEIARYGYETISDALQFVRDIYISNDRNYTYVGVRGFSRPTDYNDRIILLLNGHRLNENVYGSCYVGNELALNLDAIEQIEIIRGPGSSLYGTGAMLAVINIITKKQIDTEHLQMKTVVGSFGKLRGTALYEKSFDHDLDLDIHISGVWGDVKGKNHYYSEYDTPETNNGIAHNLDWEKYYGVLATAKLGDISIQGLVTSRSKGIPTGAYGIVFNNPSAKTLDAMANVGLMYERELNGNKSLTFRSSYLRYDYKGVYPYESESTKDKIVGEQVMLGGQMLWDVSSEYRVVMGFEGIYSPTTYYSVSSGSVISFDKNISSSVVSPYIHNEYQFTDFITLIAGIRSDIYSNQKTYVAPRFAALITPWNGTTIKALYGEAFRTPNFAELYYEDVPSGFKMSDGLKPERIGTLEGIVEQRMGDEYFSTLSVYRYAMNDLIDTRQDPADSLFHYENISSVVANGISVGIQARYQSGIAAFAHYSYQRTVDKSSDAILTNSPEHLVRWGVAIPFLERLTISTSWVYETGRVTVYRTSTGPFLLGNAAVVWRSIVPGLEVSVRVRNILNRSYAVPGGVEHMQPAIAQDPLSFDVAIQYSF